MRRWMLAAAAAAAAAGLLTVAHHERWFPFAGRARLPATANMTPIKVNVIPDGFTTSNTDEALIADFKRDVLEAVKNNDPFDILPLTAIDFKVSTHRVATSLRSDLGITTKKTPCYFDLDANFRKNLDDLKLDPAALNIVLMHIDKDVQPDLANVGACAKAKDLIITSNLLNRHAIAHEMGHAIGALRDETDDSGAPFSASGGTVYQQPNCTTARAHPEWCFGDCKKSPGPFEGCDSFKSGLFRPTDDCRMRSPASSFCCVCTEYMRRKLVDLLHFDIPEDKSTCTVVTKKPPAPQSPRPAFGTLVTVDFYSRTDARIVDGPRPGAGDARAELITGDLFASLVSDQKVVASVPLFEDPEVARAYLAKLEDGKPIHTPAKAPFPTRITFFVPTAIVPEPKPVLIPLPGNSGLKLLDANLLQTLTTKLLTIGSSP